MKDFRYDNLTFLLLIKDRPQFLKRWIKFHINENDNINIFIADGGKKSISNDDFKKINNKKNIKYHKYKYDKDYRSFAKKVLLSLKKIKTKYVLFCSDDDFLNFKAIFKAKKTLEQQKYISAITGKYISFQGYDKYNRIFSQPSGLSFMYSTNYKFFNNKYKRLKYFLNNHPYGLFHYMSETSILKKAYTNALNLKIKNADLLDLAVNIYLYGRLRILNHNSVFHLHQFHENSEAQNRNYNQLLKSKSNLLEIRYLINSVAKDYNKSKKKILEDIYFFIKKEAQKTLNKKKNFLILKLKNIIINKFVFRLSRQYFLFKSNREKTYFLKQLNSTDKIFLERVYEFFRITNYFTNK